MDYRKVIWLSTLCELIEKALAGDEFVELWLDEGAVGGASLRIKGNMLYCNIPDVGTFEQQIPDAIMIKAQKLLDKLKARLEAETTPPP